MLDTGLRAANHSFNGAFMQTLIARLLGREDVDSIDSIRMSFGADWAHDGPAWVLFGCLAFGFAAALFYLKYQTRAKRGSRILLGFLRGFVLCVLLLILADPILEVAFTSHPRPALWVLFDGTDSMNIASSSGSLRRMNRSAPKHQSSPMATFR
jgi:hypothetical protein